jgi:hypothetical protein
MYVPHLPGLDGTREQKGIIPGVNVPILYELSQKSLKFRAVG